MQQGNNMSGLTSITLSDITPQMAMAVLGFYADMKAREPSSHFTAPADMLEHADEPDYDHEAAAAPGLAQMFPGVTPPRAEAAPTFKPQVPTGSNDVDANGVPYDVRYMSANRTKTEAGVWRLRKGMDAATKAAALAYIAQFTAPAPAATAPAATAPAATAPAFTPPAGFQMPTPPAPKTPFVVGKQYPPIEYDTWFQRFTRTYEAGRIDEQGVVAMNVACGLAPNADMNPYAINETARAASFAYMAAYDPAVVG
jgi:hypothetical protein